MKYIDFEDAFSVERLNRYVTACNGDTRKAMTLYRYNLRLSQELFTLISCFEVTLRNRIDRHLKTRLGNDWLRDAILPNGALYYDRRVEKTRKIIEKVYNEQMRQGVYSHSKLLSEMEFGVWKYMFSNVVYALMGQTLLRIFPRKPTSSRQHQYDNSYIFQELDYINKLRNRIAHHEPICFNRPNAVIDTAYALNQYVRMMRLFS
ncbi:MAG: Abi family protein [Bacteroidaceae bacterium]|nr:Abi family protein [Bacteroidaceae bacterium]